MTYICNFCNKELSTKFNLSKHLTTCKRKDEVLQKEKFEKEIQSLKEENIKLKENFEKEILNQKEIHEKEIIYLKENHEKEIQSLNDQLAEFKSQIFEIAKQPKTTNHNNQKINIINQLAVYDLTEENVRSIVNEHFTEEVFKGGIEKIKKLVVDKIITDSESKKPKIVMTDASRLNAKYLTDSGEIKTDVGCEKTYNLLKNPLLDRNDKICIDLVDNQNEREIKRRMYDQQSRNEQSINNKNQFVKTTILNI
jgi:hypothetical protein